MSTPPIPVDRIITIDFETYFSPEYGLRIQTTEGYIRDPRFEVILVGVKEGNKPAVWMERVDFELWCEDQDFSRTGILCHHTHFDGLILAHHFGIEPAFWFDTMSMARVIHPGIEVGGSLKALAEKYGAGVKGDDTKWAFGLRRRDFTPEQWNQYGRYCANDCELTYSIFEQMCRKGFPDLEMWLIDMTIRMFTDPSFEAGKAELKQFLLDEAKRKEDLLKRSGVDKASLMSNDQFALVLLEAGIDPPRKISAKTGKETWAFAKSDPGMKALLEHERDEVRWLAEARVGVKSTINQSRTARFLDCASRGKLPVYLKYGAAHTFRWGGADKLNFQNLERTNKKDPSKGRLRKALMAPDGDALVVVDSGAIEARGVAWLAEHETLLAGFRENRDIYSEFASEIYGRKIDRKANPADELPGFVGKVCILGLGYGMGWRKFAMTMLSGAMGGSPVRFGLVEAAAVGLNMTDITAFGEFKRDEIESIPTRLRQEDMVVHCTVAKAIVDKYRRLNKPITDLWKLGDQVLEWMLLGVHRAFGPGGCLRTVRHGIELPSGLVMKYPGLELDRNGGSGFTYLVSRGGKAVERTKTYGGSLVENLCQALARIIVAEQVLKCGRGGYGYKVVTTTHDEGVFCVPEKEAPAAYQEILAEFKRAPDWAKGWPLHAEGGFGKRYGSIK